MKKIYSYGAVGFLVLSMLTVSASALADNNGVGNGNGGPSTSVMKSSENGMMNGVSMMVNVNQNGKGKIAGTVASISGNTLSLNSWGGVWVVDISNAKLVRRFGGTSSVSEIQAKDTVVVSGTVGTSGWTMTATQLQDMSIQTRNVSPSGTVSNITTNGFTLTTSSKTYSVTFDPTTTMISQNGVKTTSSAIVAGARAQVRGVLDRTESTIAATRINISVPRVTASGDNGNNGNQSSNSGGGNQ